MIVLAHINAKGNLGYDTQISFLKWSIQKYRIPVQFHVVYGTAKGEYEVIKKKSESNRLYAISDFIKKNKLYNEDVIVLDPDTIFVRSIDVSKYTLPVGTIRSQYYQNYIDAFPEHKTIAESVFGKGVLGTICPFIGKGKTIVDLFDFSLYTLLGYHSRNLKSQWESGMYAIGTSLVKGNFNTIVDNFWPVANYYEETFVKNDYDGIHYGFEIPLKNGESFKKWNSFTSYNSEPKDINKHVSGVFIDHLKQFEKRTK